MSASPLAICRHPGCGALVARGYCDKHQRSTGKALYDATRRKTDPALAMAARIRNSTQWQKVRSLHRSLEPLCCDPFKDHEHRPAPNQASHHILPLVTHPQLAFDLANLAPLCTSCHAKVERMERNGLATAYLFTSLSSRANTLG
jgi:5-methylcytosine-specific restriction endonuclease McrA